IPDNDFSGHFCIHFLESTTHKSNEPDLGHQMMVYKAAGFARAWTAGASPELLAAGLLDALNEKDPEWVRILTEGVEFGKQAALLKEMTEMIAVKTVEVGSPDSKEGPLSAPLQSKVVFYPLAGGKHSEKWRMLYVRPS